MKYTFLLLVCCWAIACEQAPKADKARVTDAESVKAPEGIAYKVDTAQSLVKWIGTKPTGQHIGSFTLSSGTLYVKDNKITGGTFKVNMKSLRNIDLASDANMKSKLESELKGPLFFDVEKFPAATFQITDIQIFQHVAGTEVLMKDATHNISGNLTMKEATKNISFPAKISIADGILVAEANFNIDRTLWGMTYRADKSVQDKLINSLVNIQFTVKAVH